MNNIEQYKGYISDVRRGYKRMGGLKVAICSTVRDCAVELKKNIVAVEKLRSYFSESYVVIVENDSIDGTKDELRSWENSSGNVIILSEDTGIKTIPSFANDAVIPEFSAHRVGLMAKYRNEYLKIVKEKSNIDYLIVVDLDVMNFSIDGIANSFGQDFDWHMVSSNGRMYYPRFGGVWYENLYYDTFAFRDYGDYNPRSKKDIFLCQQKMKFLKKGMGLIKVRSGFNGLAIYSFEGIKNANYGVKFNGDPEVEAECEHVFFHDEIKINGYDSLYVNPSQVVFYNKLSLNKYLKQLIK